VKASLAVAKPGAGEGSNLNPVDSVHGKNDQIVLKEMGTFGSWQRFASPG
jgi:hypothetical protein